MQNVRSNVTFMLECYFINKSNSPNIINIDGCDCKYPTRSCVEYRFPGKGGIYRSTYLLCTCQMIMCRLKQKYKGITEIRVILYYLKFLNLGKPNIGNSLGHGLFS